MQISKKEREVFTENKFKEVANLISTKIVHPVTEKTFPIDTIETAMREINFKAKLDVDTKKQAMECIKVKKKLIIFKDLDKKLQNSKSKDVDQNINFEVVQRSD